MFITDYLRPRFIAKKDLEQCSDSLQNLEKQVSTYTNTLAVSFLKKEEASLKRNLSRLQKRIAPLEVDHARFLKGVSERKNSISQMAGLSPDVKNSLRVSAENASVLTLRSKGRETILNIRKILCKKKLLCIKANKRIIRANDHFQRLHKRYEYRLANYLRVVNTHPDLPEIHTELNATPRALEEWNYELPDSSVVAGFPVQPPVREQDKIENPHLSTAEL